MGDGQVTASVFDIANRLTEDDAFTYTYDANGNLETKTAKVAGVCTGGVTTFIWNAQNQLIQIDFPDLTTAAYRYDGLGRRIEKDVDGLITRYVYAGENILLEYDGTNTLLARYSHGLGSDQPLGVERGGQSFFYQADHEGSVTQVTDAGGFVVNSYEYDSYGNIETSIEGIANPFTYTGREQDPESGLYYYRARYYDPEIGRFLNEDPLGFTAGDANLYRYVFNNPVNLTDPDGMQAAPPMPMPGLPFPIPPIAIPGSPENEAWTNAVVTLMGKISKKFKDIFGGSRPDIPRGDAVGRGRHVCVALCSVVPASAGCECPPSVSGTGYGKTRHEASVNAQKSANNIVPDGCRKKHCDVQCWEAKGPQGR